MNGRLMGITMVSKKGGGPCPRIDWPDKGAWGQTACPQATKRKRTSEWAVRTEDRRWSRVRFGRGQV